MNEKECRTKKNSLFQSKVTNNFLNSCVLNNVKKLFIFN